MIARRELLGGTVLGGWLGGGGVAAAAGEPQDRVDVSEIVRALDRLRGTMAESHGFPEIADVRERQKEYLRLHGKLPDVIEVGVDVWFDAYDWHIRHLQPAATGRDANGRYTIGLMETLLIMRPDFQQARYIGPPYDNDNR